MATPKENVYQLLATGGDNIKVVLQLLKGPPELKKAIEEELLPVLKIMGKKTLRSLPKLLEELEEQFKKAFRKEKVDVWLNAPFIRQQLSKLTTLDLSWEDLEVLPSSIGQIAHLTALNLHKNCQILLGN